MEREKEQDSTILPVIVHPKASEDRIAGFHGEALKVKVTAPPTGGKANQRLVEILADQLNIAKSNIPYLEEEGCADMERQSSRGTTYPGVPLMIRVLHRYNRFGLPLIFR